MKEQKDALPTDADRDSDRRPSDPTLQAELRFYRDLFAACCGLIDAHHALDAAAEDDEQAWDTFVDALDEVEEFIATVRHADAMDAAGVTCNELHHGKVTLSA